MTLELSHALDSDGVAAVRTRGLTRWFGDHCALDEVGLIVPKGAVYVLAGANGAGKTTLLRSLMELSRVDRGTVELFGDGEASPAQRRAQIGYVPDNHEFGYRWMRVGELLASHAGYFPHWDRSYAAELNARFSIDDRPRFGQLSRGQARRVQLVMALAHRPRLLLLDEPSEGLDPLVRDELGAVLAEFLAESGASLLMSTHHMHDVIGLADHLGVLVDGRLAAQVSRARLETELNQIHARVPEGWSASRDLESAVLERKSAGREISWTMWGSPDALQRELVATGAEVLSLDPLGFEHATRCLLRLGGGV